MTSAFSESGCRRFGGACISWRTPSMRKRTRNFFSSGSRWTSLAPRRCASPVYVGLTGRDPRLDWLRGYCFLVMTIDHFGGRSRLYALTGQTQFFTSAAEAFYLISGLTLGIATNSTRPAI